MPCPDCGTMSPSLGLGQFYGRVQEVIDRLKNRHVDSCSGISARDTVSCRNCKQCIAIPVRKHADQCMINSINTNMLMLKNNPLQVTAAKAVGGDKSYPSFTNSIKNI